MWLVGGWFTNPPEKYAQVKWDIFPEEGVNIEQIFGNQHLDDIGIGNLLLKANSSIDTCFLIDTVIKLRKQMKFND